MLAHIAPTDAQRSERYGGAWWSRPSVSEEPVGGGDGSCWSAHMVRGGEGRVLARIRPTDFQRRSGAEERVGLVPERVQSPIRAGWSHAVRGGGGGTPASPRRRSPRGSRKAVGAEEGGGSSGGEVTNREVEEEEGPWPSPPGCGRPRRSPACCVASHVDGGGGRRRSRGKEAVAQLRFRL